MKKIISIICILAISLLVFIPVVFALPSDTAPSKATINRAIAWAQSFELKDSFPLPYGAGSAPSYFKCVTFVANAYGFGNSPSNAYLLWFISDKHPGDWDAPRGSLVFFDRNATNIGYGHVALSTGNGNLIEAGYPIIIANTISAENKEAPYLGWAWPPSTWPGRSGASFVATPAFIAILYAVVLALGVGTGLLSVKIKGKSTAAKAK